MDRNSVVANFATTAADGKVYQVDYDPRMETSVLFFKTVQNKMHWAAHGQTAAEKIYFSADSTKPNIGLFSFLGNHSTQADAFVAKNYCN